MTSTLNQSLYAHRRWREYVWLSKNILPVEDRDVYCHLAAIWQKNHVIYHALYWAELRA